MSISTTTVELEFTTIVVNVPFVVGIQTRGVVGDVYLKYGALKLTAVQGPDYSVLIAPDLMTFQVTPYAPLLDKIADDGPNVVYVGRLQPLTSDFDNDDAFVREKIVHEFDRVWMAGQEARFLITDLIEFAGFTQDAAESAAAAADSAAAALISEQNADASEAAALASQTAAAASATAALASQNAAQLFATNAANSQNSAIASANAAATSATNAGNSATAAAGSATTATTQAGVATTQAGIATTQAGIATTQATNAAASAVAADASADAALISETNAAASAGAVTVGTTTDALTGTATNKTVTPDALAALWERGSDITAVNPLVLGEGGYFAIVGPPVTITDIDFATPKNGRRAVLWFTQGHTIVHSNALALPGGLSIITNIGDTAEFIQSLDDSVICINYTRAVNDGVDRLRAFRNLVINGDMAVDQRFNGAGFLLSAGQLQYAIDRWLAFIEVGGTGQLIVRRDPDNSGLAGDNMLLLFSQTADATLAAADLYHLLHRIEGINCRGLYWGTGFAKPITISFEVTATIAGTFTLAVRNAAANRSWIGSFPVTTGWTKVVMTIPGDTTGTWLTDNGVGISVAIALGAGTNFHGVAGWQAGNKVGLAGMSNHMASASQSFMLRKFQVEAGPIATDFERVPYDVQLERCLRYYETKLSPGIGFWGNVTTAFGYTALGDFAVPKRATPTLVLTNINNSAFPATVGSVLAGVSGYAETRTANATGSAGFFHSSSTADAEL